MNTTRPQIHRYQAPNGIKSLPNIKNIIAVASGKGGVGKSTVAINLAFELQTQGARVGLLDADIYGPSQPLMLGVQTKPIINEDKSMAPIVVRGLQTMSIGYLIDPHTPAVWRGPMVSGALTQMLTGTDWQDLDFLVIDLPPGTGDIQLTLAQKVPVCGVVMVTTPQEVALIDVAKALAMFKRVQVPIFGIVENMSTHICSQCGHIDAIFGHGGGEKLAAEYAVPLLAKLPLHSSVLMAADQGQPIVLLEPDGEYAQKFAHIAKQVVLELNQLKRDMNVPIGKIVIEEG